MSETKLKEFHVNAGPGFVVTEEVFAAYRDDGCFIIKGLYSLEEIKALKQSWKDDREDLKEKKWKLDNGKVNIWMWNHPGRDVTGLVARSRKLVDIIEKLNQGEVYHYYSAVVKKGPHNGSDSRSWHQDYAHWYKYGCLLPDMTTAYIPLDPVHRRNGCLQVWVGSPRAGRLDHKEIDGVVLADKERVRQLSGHLGMALVEIEPGDVFIRNCNLLHASGRSYNDDTRLELFITYNKAINQPVYQHHHHGYTPIDKVDDVEILRCQTNSLEGKDFLDPSCSNEVRDELFRVGFH